MSSSVSFGDGDSSVSSSIPVVSLGDGDSSVSSSVPAAGIGDSLNYPISSVSGGPVRGSSGARVYAPLHYPGHTGRSFNILLSYPDGERVSHFYSVFHGMPVSGLRYNISCLLRVDSLVFLFVGPTWEALDHRGTITDRCLPGTHLPCPFLGDGSSVRVHCARLSVPALVLPGAVASVIAPALGRQSSPPLSARSSTSPVPVLVLGAPSLPLGAEASFSSQTSLPLAASSSFSSDSASSDPVLGFPSLPLAADFSISSISVPSDPVFNVSQSSLVCFSDSSDLVSSPPAFVGLATEASSGLPLLSGGLVARLIGIAGKPLCLLLQSFLSTNSWIRRTVVNFLSPIYALTILLISVVRRRVPTVGSRGMARMGSTFFRHS